MLLYAGQWILSESRTQRTSSTAQNPQKLVRSGVHLPATNKSVDLPPTADRIIIQSSESEVVRTSTLKHRCEDTLWLATDFIHG